jgi:AcrR family transcriptional regulator
MGFKAGKDERAEKSSRHDSVPAAAAAVEVSEHPGPEAPPSPLPQKMRADARRNREKLIETAATAFTEHGVEASLEEIARRAGVGIGTLYRHFPTREHLVEIVYRREVEAVCGAAVELSRRLPSDQALEQWMLRFVDYIATKRGLAASLKILLGSDSTLRSETAGRVSLTLKQMVDTAVADGAIRGDIDATDVTHALSSIYSAPDTADWRERSHRLVSLLMGGLRWGAPKSR